MNCGGKGSSTQLITRRNFKEEIHYLTIKDIIIVITGLNAYAPLKQRVPANGNREVLCEKLNQLIQTTKPTFKMIRNILLKGNYNPQYIEDDEILYRDTRNYTQEQLKTKILMDADMQEMIKSNDKTVNDPFGYPTLRTLIQAKQNNFNIFVNDGENEQILTPSDLTNTLLVYYTHKDGKRVRHEVKNFLSNFAKYNMPDDKDFLIIIHDKITLKSTRFKSVSFEHPRALVLEDGGSFFFTNVETYLPKSPTGKPMGFVSKPKNDKMIKVKVSYVPFMYGTNGMRRFPQESKKGQLAMTDWHIVKGIVAMFWKKENHTPSFTESPEFENTGVFLMSQYDFENHEGQENGIIYYTYEDNEDYVMNLYTKRSIPHKCKEDPQFLIAYVPQIQKV